MNENLKTVTAGPYTLVARFNQGSFRGALWSKGRIEVKVEGLSIDEVWRKLTDELYVRQVTLALDRNGVPPSAADVAKALLRILPRIGTGQKAMLRAHLNAPEQRITASELANAAGYVSFSGANVQYGLLGAMLFAELPEELPRRADGSPIMTCSIAHGEDQRDSNEEQWVWKMREHVVEGLTLAAIV